MKKILSALLFILVITPLAGVQNITDTGQTAAVKEYNLPEAEGRAWNSIRDEWMKNQYRSCLKKFNLKMNCAHCVYIYIKAEITIDSNKKLKTYRKTGENVCGEKISTGLEKCFMESLEQQTFPDELKGRKFETMLGTGLKC